MQHLQAGVPKAMESRASMSRKISCLAIKRRVILCALGRFTTRLVRLKWLMPAMSLASFKHLRLECMQAIGSYGRERGTRAIDKARALSKH